MQFNSYLFACFFAVVMTLYSAPFGWRTRKCILLFASYIFYAAWNPPFVLLLVASTVIDWFCAHAIHRANEPRRRRSWLLVSIFFNLGILGYFKYGPFLVESAASLAQVLGVAWTPATPSIVLPIGISFYCFQTLSYTLDVYNRRMEPGRSFLDYALFVTFFPQLVAGPIVRAPQFLPQCDAPRRATRDQFAWGLAMVVLGLFEKVVVADALMAPSVEKVYESSVTALSMLD